MHDGRKIQTLVAVSSIVRRCLLSRRCCFARNVVTINGTLINLDNRLYHRCHEKYCVRSKLTIHRLFIDAIATRIVAKQRQSSIKQTDERIEFG